MEKGMMMATLLIAAMGVDEDFNCANFILTAEDTDRLEADVRARRLSHTDGFFFGVRISEEEEDDLLFITKAREALAAGLSSTSRRFQSTWVTRPRVGSSIASKSKSKKKALANEIVRSAVEGPIYQTRVQLRAAL
ncbi:uncharacterized protein FOMMEDRAFT_157975 [Fomitiporia mediterranea MF3/22]|uniref:uncharacterized protein n=1 Tax=Fomitiporia mediterranea (strain MF3/22) TaxID=694068 RepID=UPI00044074E0|nr:uncharacterized protein FOMMEDRAFT_157975 [Fomitiporia mediterranea MF3/22]EJD00864.1 hypothetical protein FOMMEDRAFT_157975 [Fomitiporia mediterranea MF3/22]